MSHLDMRVRIACVFSFYILLLVCMSIWMSDLNIQLTFVLEFVDGNLISILLVCSKKYCRWYDVISCYRWGRRRCRWLHRGCAAVGWCRGSWHCGYRRYYRCYYHRSLVVELGRLGMIREHPTEFPIKEGCDVDDSRHTGSPTMIQTVGKTTIIVYSKKHSNRIQRSLAKNWWRGDPNNCEIGLIVCFRNTPNILRMPSKWLADVYTWDHIIISPSLKIIFHFISYELNNSKCIHWSTWQNTE